MGNMDSDTCVFLAALGGLALAVAGIVGLGSYCASTKNKSAAVVAPQKIEQVVQAEPARPVYTVDQFQAAARAQGLTGLYLLTTGRDLSDVTAADYRRGGAIHQWAQRAGVDLFDESKEPANFKKNGINDMMTPAQVETAFYAFNQ